MSEHEFKLHILRTGKLGNAKYQPPTWKEILKWFNIAGIEIQEYNLSRPAKAAIKPLLLKIIEHYIDERQIPTYIAIRKDVATMQIPSFWCGVNGNYLPLDLGHKLLSLEVENPRFYNPRRGVSNIDLERYERVDPNKLFRR